VYRASKGSINLSGTELVGKSPTHITTLGIARTFQNIRLFKDLTVLDNVRIAHYSQASYTPWESLLHIGRYRAEEKRILDNSMDLLSVFKLDHLSDELAKNLPYGSPRRLEIARALATEPRLLLLDEPAAGMNPSETVNLMELIHFIRDRFKLTILLIEHQMRVVMGICEWITVMDFGQVIARGTPRDIQANERVIEAYLGRRLVKGVAE